MRTPKVLLSASAVIFLTVLAINGQASEIFGVTRTFAQNSAGVNTISGGMMQAGAALMALIITGINTLMWVLFKLIEALLEPTLIFDAKDGTDGPLLQMLHNIWLFSRDLMNLVFAFLLIFGAIVTIVKGKGETVKEYLPKFVFAIVLVNFSWFIPRALFDVSQVLTYTAFQLPSLIATNVKCEVRDPAFVITPNGKYIMKDCDIVTDVKFLEDTDTVTDGQGGWSCIGPLVCIQKKPVTDPTLLVTSDMLVLNGLIINHARLATLVDVVNPVNNPPPVGTRDQPTRDTIMVLMKLLLVLLIHVGLFFPMVGIATALFLRIPLLWVTTAFMPFAVLGYIIGDKIPGGDTAKKIWTHFLSAMFLPAMVAVPLSLGFVMINAGLNVPGPPALNVKFPLLSQVTDIWELLWMTVSFLVLWVGVFAALKQNEITSHFVDGIKGMGEAAGRFAIKAPLAIPFIPAPGGGDQKMSLLGAFQHYNPKTLEGKLNSGDPISKKFFGYAPESTRNSDAAASIIKKNENNIQGTINLKISEIGNPQTPGKRDDAVKAIVDALRLKNSAITESDLPDAINKALKEGVQIKDSQVLLDAIKARAEEAKKAAEKNAQANKPAGANP